MRRELRFLLRFKGDVRALKTVQVQFRKLGRVAKTVAAQLGLVAAGFKAMGRAALRAGKVVVAQMGRIRKLAAAMAGSIRTAGAALAAFGIGIGLTVVIRTLASFEAQMARVRAITGATGAQFEALTNTARRLGATTFFSATEAAQGLTLLGQAGFSVGESIRAVAATLDLAIAGGIDLAQATDITASALRGFNLSATESVRVADVLAKVSTSANTTIAELGEALKFVAPVAAAVNVSIEQAAAAIGVMSDAGLKGTLAGTGLRRILVGLVNVTPKGTKALARLGLTMADVDSNTKSLAEIMETLREANLGAAEAFDLFGLRGGPAILVLTSMSERLKELTGSAEEAAGSAKAMADIIADTLVGDLKALRSALEEVFLQQNAFGDALRGTVKEVTGVLRALAGLGNPLDENAARFEEVAERIESLGRTMKLLGAIVALVLRPLTALIAVVTDVVDAIARVDSVATGAAAAIKTLASPLNLISRIFGGGEIDAGIQSFLTGLESVNKAVTDTRGQIERNFDQLRAIEELRGEDLIDIGPEIQANIDRTVSLLARLGKEAQAVQQAIEEEGAEPGLVRQAKEIQEAIDEANESLRLLGARRIEAAQVEEGLERIRKASQAAAEEGKRVGEELNKAFSEAGAGLDELEKTIADQEFEIGQLQLGPGAAANLQREINKAVKAAGLEVDLPVRLEIERGKLLERVAELEKVKAAAKDLSEEEQKALDSQIEANKEAIERIDENKTARIKLRGEIVEGVKALNKEKETSKALTEAEKAFTRVRKELLPIDQRIAEARADLIEKNVLLRESGSALALSDEQLNKVLEEQEKKLRKGTDEFRRREQAIKDAATAEKAFKDGLAKLNADLDVQFDTIGKTNRQIEEATIRSDLLVQAEKGLVRGIDESAKAFEKRRTVTLAAAEADVKAFLARKRLAEQAQRTDIIGAAKRQIEEFVDASTNAAKITEQAFSTAFSALDTQLKNFVKTGVFNFREFALTILDEIAVLAAKAAIATALKPVLGAADGGGGILDIIRAGLGITGPAAAPEAAPSPAGVVGAVAGAVPDAEIPGAVPGGAIVGILETGFGKLADLGQAGLEQGAELAGTLLSGVTTALTFLGSLLSTVFTAGLTFLGSVFTVVTTAASAVVAGAVTAGSFIVAAAVQIGAALQVVASFAIQGVLLVIQAFQAIIAAFAILPFPFAQGGVTTSSMAGGQRGAGGVNPSVFLGARRFQAGGISDEDTIPALLKPEEAIIPLAGGAVPVQITPSGDQAPTREPRTIQVTITVNANDAESFVESQQEIATKMAEEIRAAEERNR